MLFPSCLSEFSPFFLWKFWSFKNIIKESNKHQPLYLYCFISESLCYALIINSVSSLQSWGLETYFINKKQRTWHYLFTSRVQSLRKTSAIMTLSVKQQPLPAKWNINLGVHILLVFTSCVNTEIPQKEPCSCVLLWRKVG